MGSRLLLAVLLALASLSVLAAQAGAASPPPASKLVLGSKDLPDGATVVSVSPSIDPTFGIAGIPTSSAFTRRFNSVTFRSLQMAQLISSAFVARKQSDTSHLLRELAKVAQPGPTRRTLVDAMQGADGVGVKGSIVRARTLKAGDAAVELVLHFTTEGFDFDMAEIWVRHGSALSAVAVVVPPGRFTLGHGTELAKLLAARLETVS